MTIRFPTPTQVYQSAGFYPITGLYLGGVGVAMLVTQQVIDIKSGFIIFAFLALLALLSATLRELKAVHKLVDGQRTELLARIDELSAILVEINVPFPAPGAREQDARDDVRREDNARERRTPEQAGTDARNQGPYPQGPALRPTPDPETT